MWSDVAVNLNVQFFVCHSLYAGMLLQFDGCISSTTDYRDRDAGKSAPQGILSSFVFVHLRRHLTGRYVRAGIGTAAVLSVSYNRAGQFALLAFHVSL